MPSLSKDAEIALLRETVARLGDDSYTGPWLREQLPQIESAIRSDLLAGVRALTVAEAYAEGAGIIERANIEAKSIRDAATAAAERLKQQADEYTQRTKADLREHLRRILGTL
jgi:F0F1-type ATP synthase membrane subunit b/b'